MKHPLFSNRIPLVVSAVLLAGMVPSTTALAGDDAPTEPKGLLPVPDYTGDFWKRGYVIGDLGGARTDLANKGLQFKIDWTQYVQSVVGGGLDTATRYGGHLDYLVKLDLMRMNVIPGAIVTLRAESRYGDSVNGKVGQVLPVNSTAYFPLTNKIDEEIPITITDLNYTQFLSEQFLVVIGKMDTLDCDLNEFASGRGKSQFMDANFLFNAATALRLPYSTLGIAAQWMPNQNVAVKGSIINTPDSSTTSGFEDFGDGATLSLEVDFQYRLGNLPGGMNVGGLYSFDQDFAKLGGKLSFQPGQGLIIPKEDETWAIYWSAWQYLWVKDPDNKPINTGDGRPDHQGIGLFARAGIADNETNPVEWSASGGIGGRGLIPSRENDTFGLGYVFTSYELDRVGGALGIQDRSQGFEAYYNIALTPAMSLTLDAQVQDPALPNVDTATVLGARLDIRF